MRWLGWLALLLAACAPRAHDATTLRFSVHQGEVHNEFFRQGAAAAHWVLTSGPAPRLVVAFPAGNSGAAIWFDAASAWSWPAKVALRPVHRGAGREQWHGVSAELSATGATLRVRQALLGSVRAIRDHEQRGTVDPDMLTAPRVSAHEIVWQRRRLDGAPGYDLSIQTLAGSSVARSADGSLALRPSADGRLSLRITAMTGERPLTPLDEARLLNANAAPDARLRKVLAFLSYEEKLLAGSWRFNTYFGRDTLMTLLLLASVARPALMEAGLSAVFERLSATGEVAHEEDIGEYAIERRLRAGLSASDRPLLDFKMIDDDFMLAPAMSAYLRERESPAAGAFLRRTDRASVPFGTLLVRNLRFVVSQAQAFAREPHFRHLVALKRGERTGNWRDSEDGLGGGRYPYDVNAVLVPAALDAVAQLARSSVLQPYLDPATRRELSAANAMSAVWSREAPVLFEVSVPADLARAEVTDYARGVGLNAEPALGSLDTAPLRFAAVALDERGAPVPILSSDEAFALLLRAPPAAEVQRIVRTLMRPFPAGLMTDVGLLVANAAYAPRDLAPQFDRNHYHGAVVWAWQQGLLAAGVEHQLARTDLTSSARATLSEARSRLRSSAAANASQRGVELWSWSVEQGKYRVAPFGQREAHDTESNAAQLWSTTDLAR